MRAVNLCQLAHTLRKLGAAILTLGLEVLLHKGVAEEYMVCYNGCSYDDR